MLKKILIPDIGEAKDVDVIELLVKAGDKVNVEDSLITLEGDKATMEIPSPYAGTIREINVQIGDKVSEGSLILTMELSEITVEESVKKIPAVSTLESSTEASETRANVYMSPSVRRIAREFSIDLKLVYGTGPRGRIQKTDLQAYVKGELAKARSGFSLPIIPIVDFSKYGKIEMRPLGKIKKATAKNVHASWVTIPHVTQFDEADITEMEAFRRERKSEVEAKGFKLTPLVFIMKAVVASLKRYPNFNSSLHVNGEQLILKQYFHLGIAVDTPHGLIVPVIRDVNKKNIIELAEELSDISGKAREKGLSIREMEGSCFTISSLGGIGGTAFTPIVKMPDVAILGVSKATMKPVYQGSKFVPRLMLPLSLSYDHRVIDGADAARFIVHLSENLSNIKMLDLE